MRTTLPITSPPTTPSTVAAFHDWVVTLRAPGVECRAIHHTLPDERAFTGSYQSVCQFMRRLEPRTAEACVRVEVEAPEFGGARVRGDNSICRQAKAENAGSNGR
jgi:hypothetical protein